jgi:hypothetical protein
MTGLAEGVQALLTYKKYASGAITDNALATSSSDLVATGAQRLRRVSSTLKFARDNYTSNEILAARQIQDFRLGTGRVTGNAVSGEWSPGTYFDFMEAACRGTKAAAISLGPSVLTSIAADNATSKFICGGGDPVASGFRVGMIVRPTNLSDTDNNAKNFLITGFSGGSNRNILVSPAPDTMTADTTFTLATVGKSVLVPSSGFVSRKFGFEIYNSDIDMYRLYTECRVGGFSLKLPATGNATIDVPVMGRWLESATGSGPFFTTPTAETTTGIIAAVNGLLQVSGSTVGVVTGINIDFKMTMTGDAVVGQNFVPEIFLGKANVTGQATAFLKDGTLLNDFKNETEISLLAYLTTTSAVGSPATTIYLPRIKFSDADVATQGEGGQSISLPFQALKGTATTSTSGIEDTTIQICDSEAV